MLIIYFPVDKYMCVYYTIYILWMCCIGSMDNIICDFIIIKFLYFTYVCKYLYMHVFVDSLIYLSG